MFRYGGPIKQGIMSGIREPKKNGGLSKQFNTGLVGDERYPKTDGREHHVAFIPPILAGLGVAGRFLARPFGSWAMKQIAKKGVTAGSGAGTIRSGLGRSRVMQPGESLTQSVNKFTPYKFWSEDPLVKAGMTGAGWTGKALKKGAGLAKWGVTTPSGLAMTLPGGFFYAKGKWWDKNNNPADPNDIAAAKASRKGTSGAPGGGDPGMYLTPQGEAPPPGKSEAQLKKEQIQKYRDIMDIKGMNKEAAANSLIEASRLINESGDFKGDLKSGSLINKIIGATSKAFDKPADTKKAIDTLILKGEIEKDLNKEKNKLDNEYKRSMIAKNEAVLAQDSLAGDLRAYATKNQALPSGNTLAAFATSRGYDIKGVEDTTEVKKWMTENGGNEVAYLEDKITDIEVAPGLYVINNKILAIDESKKITPVI